MSEIDAVRVLLRALADMPPLADDAKRVAFEQWGLTHPLPVGTTVTPATLGGVAAEKLVPPGAAADSALLYLHGGGYVIGSTASHRHLAASIAAASLMTGYAIDYARAPETRFPGALDDSLAAYSALLTDGLVPGQIIIAGDSAGGGLALATALAIKAAGLPQPAGLFVISPWADLTLTGPSYAAFAESDLICSHAELDRMASLYCDAADRTNPLVSPLFGDFAGLPPLLIHVGSDEILLSDSIRLAERAGFARVKVKLLIAPDMPHVWHFMTTELGAARSAIGNAGLWIRDHLV
jgi:epsilon-lactone hydrolase